jgi:TPR repeat protein
MGKGGSAGSKSATKLESQDGDIAACDSSTPDSKQPPAQCGAIVRIELEPIGAAAPAKPELAVVSCAPGFAVSDGACVRPDKPHQCSPEDAAACKTQCDAGNAGSCATAAALGKDIELAKKACDANVMLGCRVQAELTKTSKDKIAILERVCAAGDGMGCVDLGNAKLEDRKLAGDAQYAYRRACYGGGEYEGCTALGMLYVDGKGGMTKNTKLATAFLNKACKEGSQKGCDELKKIKK